jgi:hypothetical protein
MPMFLGENSGFISVRMCAYGPRGRWVKSSRPDFKYKRLVAPHCGEPFVI